MKTTEIDLARASKTTPNVTIERRERKCGCWKKQMCLQDSQNERFIVYTKLKRKTSRNNVVFSARCKSKQVNWSKKQKEHTIKHTHTHERFALRSFPFDSHTAVTKVDVYFCLKTQLYVCESARVTSIVCNFLSLHHTHTPKRRGRALLIVIFNC